MLIIHKTKESSVEGQYKGKKSVKILLSDYTIDRNVIINSSSDNIILIRKARTI